MHEEVEQGNKMDDNQCESEVVRMLHESPSERISYYAYQELSHALHEYYLGIDADMVLVTLSLFLVALLILSPRSSFRGLSLNRRRVHPDCQAWPEHQDQHVEGEEGLSSTRTMSTNNSMYADDEETDEEKFEKLWPTICASGYRRLVLPPECKLVYVPAFMKRLKEEQRKEKHARNQNAEITDDDHPLTRLTIYSEQLLHLLRTLLSYDYMKAGQMLINWIQCWLRLKQRKASANFVEEGDEDDVLALSPMKRNEGTGLASDLVENDLLREVSVMSDAYHSVSGSDDDENDIGPLQVYNHSSHGHSGRKKDALDSYRSAAQQIGPLTPTKPTLSVAPTSPQMRTPRQDEEDLQDPSRLRNDSVGMTFFDAAHSKASLRRLNVEVPVPDR